MDKEKIGKRGMEIYLSSGSHMTLQEAFKRAEEEANLANQAKDIRDLFGGQKVQ